MPYRVIIDVKNQWWSDQREFPTFTAARNHRKAVAQRWNDCATAIAAPDARVLAWQESIAAAYPTWLSPTTNAALSNASPRS